MDLYEIVYDDEGFRESVDSLHRSGQPYDSVLLEIEFALEYELKRQPTTGTRTTNIEGDTWAIVSDGPPPIVLFYDVDEANRRVVLRKINAIRR
ncbi:MAG: hypothetical protein OXL97_10535 [Chloroflexota bacterium]|nr:hypothetical protein [Chloroflexota bacterium]MDE2886156.1 hypothetical protein [Chloroflexota bacterium]